MKLRLDKILSDSGLGTRSNVKDMIRKGLISINGSPVTDPGFKADPDSDMITFDGERISYSEYEYIMLNKPGGVITASSDKKQRTVLDLITEKGRRDLFPVGRLDKDTEGLLLITNDGDLAHKLLSPSSKVEKLYIVKVTGERITPDTIKAFAEGVDIGDIKKAAPARLRLISEELSPHALDGRSIYDSEAEVTVTEGRFHEVKRLFQTAGCEVTYLKRLSMGTLRLDESLAPGSYRHLSKDELEKLRTLS